MSQNEMYSAKVNSPPTSLSGGVTVSDTDIPVIDVSVLPNAPNLATIIAGSVAETILYTGINSNTLTGVTRGFQGVAQAWDSGATIIRAFTAYDHDAFKNNIEDLNTKNMHQNAGAIQTGINANAEGDSTSAVTNNSHAEGRYTLADNGNLYAIIQYDDVAKTVTLDKVTGLVVGDVLDIKRVNLAALLDIPIIAITDLIVTLDTLEIITSDWKYVIERKAASLPVHAEGTSTIACGTNSHAEGNYAIASGGSSHAEGNYTLASGINSHAEGNGNTASGVDSHAQNKGTIAQGQSQTVIGEYNTPQGAATSKIATDNAFIIGNGTDNANRSNALTVNWQGDLETAGSIKGKNINLSSNKYEILTDTFTNIIEIWGV